MTTIQINVMITLPLHLNQSSGPNYFFLLADPLFLSSRWQVVKKRGKNNLGVIASPLPHSIFSNCTPVKGHPGPLLNHIFLSCFKLESSDVSDMKDELPPLRPSLFSHVPPFFNYIPNGRDGRCGLSS